MSTVFRLVPAPLVLAIACSAPAPSQADSHAELLAIHEQVLEAHRTGNVELWMAVEADEYVSANGGTITHPTRAERRAMREPYLQSTSFEVYRDLTEPIAQVSPDGQLGWVIAQVEIKGTQTAADSTIRNVEAVWAWIEMYRRIDGRWQMVGNVSNQRQ